MSILNALNRAVVVFDVENKKHRQLFAEFARTNSWKNSPVQFIANEATDSDVGTIMRQVAVFYANREFKKRVDRKGKRAYNTTTAMHKAVLTQGN